MLEKIDQTCSILVDYEGFFPKPMVKNGEKELQKKPHDMPPEGEPRERERFQSIVMSCEQLKLGSSYTVYYGKDLNSLTQGDTVTFTSVSMSTGSSFGGGWGGPRR